jgi:hypothetical protein
MKIGEPPSGPLRPSGDNTTNHPNWGAAVRNCFDTRNRKSGAGARTGYLASLFRFQGAVCEAHAD